MVKTCGAPVTLFFWIGLICFALSLAIALELATGIGRMTRLGDISPTEEKDLPKVSVIIPACNEADTIEPALRTVLAMEYDNLEVIVVNDRSTDVTGSILARMAKEYSPLRVYQVDTLPGDWLGKNHALHFGAAHATGDYLLFTDADIHMEKSSLSRTMHHILQNGLDHLSVFFQNKGGSGLLNALFLEVGGGLLLLFKPWKARYPKSKRFMGVGAFNLIKSDTYKKLGGHQKIAMHPIDDVMLGKLVKVGGFRQDCMLGNDFVTVHWYGTVREFISGLMKNVFAVYRYKVGLVAIVVFFVFLLGILPFWALFFTEGWARLFFAGVLAIRLLSFAHGFRESTVSPLNAPWSLVTPHIMIYIVIKATVQTLRNNGITWRGTHYPLEKLKRYLV